MLPRWRRRLRRRRWLRAEAPPDLLPPDGNHHLPIARPVHDEEEDDDNNRNDAMRLHIPNPHDFNNNQANANMNQANNNNDNNPIPMADVFIWMRRHEVRAAGEGAEDDPTSVLFEEICQHASSADDCTWRGSGCRRIVERCRTHPSDILWVCPHTWRQPWHQAALQCACPHVMEALEQAVAQVSESNHNSLQHIIHMDRWSNTILHMFFNGLRTRQWSVERVQATLAVLLRAIPPALQTRSNHCGQNALHVACQGSPTLVPHTTMLMLLDATSSSSSSWHKADRYSKFPLHYYCARRGARVDVAQRLVEGHPAALRAIDQDRATPLHYAAAVGHGPLMSYLVDADGHALYRRAWHDETPLHCLCRHKPTAALVPALQRMLLEAPDIVTWRESRRGCTALHLLCQSDTVPLALIEVLVQAHPALVTIPTQRVDMPADELPLHTACRVGLPLPVVQALIQAEPSTVRAVTHKKDTPLSLACLANQSLETVQLLLSLYPEAAVTANDYGFLPIHCLVRTYQPQRAMVTALLQAAPQSLTHTTHGGETALHLLSNNNSASATLWHDLQRALRQLPEAAPHAAPKEPGAKLGNTPLHLACFRGAGTEQLEALMIHHPGWLTVTNAAGQTPLQILCKSGRVDADKLTLFSRLGGPGLFSTADATGNTPLHSAMRSETDFAALQTLLKACPRALHMKTIYDDTPLHLACLRHVSPDIVHAVAVASCQGIESTLAHCEQRISPILLRNSAGQSPIAIAIDEYQKAFPSTSLMHCGVQAEFRGDQRRAFDVLSILVQLLHYGPSTMEQVEGQNLVLACLCLHRKNVRLPPAFIRRVIMRAPEQVVQADAAGNYPLHVEAGIPVEKMSLLDVAQPSCCAGRCAQRSGILHLLLEMYPQAASKRNDSGHFPLDLMVQNGRQWDHTFTWVLRAHPQAFHWIEGITPGMIPRVLARYDLFLVVFCCVCVMITHSQKLTYKLLF